MSQDYEEILKEMDNQFVSPQGWTRGELSEAFDKVKNQENWKEPINARIPRVDYPMVGQAIIFFTGSVPKFVFHADYTVSVTADGYYQAVGS